MISRLTMHFSQFSYSSYCSCVLPSQDCWPVLRLYPAVHMQALVVGEVGKHSWEQSPLLLLHRLTPAKEKIRGTKTNIFFTSICIKCRRLYIHFRTCNSFSVTFLHILIIDPHVHHWGGVVSQNFPVSSILLVTCSYLVSSLIGPPQLVSYIIDVTRI